MSTVTGLELDAICADLTTFVPGRQLDDDGSLLLRFTSGAKGILMATQIAIGGENDLRLRVWGTDGSLTWHQEDPNQMIFDPLDGPRQVFPARRRATWPRRPGGSPTSPPGHPEAFMEAFGNVYRGVEEAIRARLEGRQLGPLEGDFPTLVDGARGVRFIEKTVESSRSREKWTKF